MSLFRDTPDYRLALDRQREVADQVAYWWDVDLVATHEAAPVDLVLTRDRTAVALAEIKTRSGELSAFLRWENTARPGFLISWDKVRDGALGAVGLHVPYRVVAGFYVDSWRTLDAVRYWELYNPQIARSRWLVEFRVERTTTQKNNDADDTRAKDGLNAFLPIRECRALDDQTRGA